MSVHQTHYVVYGVALQGKAEVKKWLDAADAHGDFLDSYNDDDYAPTPMATKSGLHIIQDGMNAEYVVVGKIIAKALEGEGLPLTLWNESGRQFANSKVAIQIQLSKIDKEVGSNLFGLKLNLIAFTHFH